MKRLNFALVSFMFLFSFTAFSQWSQLEGLHLGISGTASNNYHIYPDNGLQIHNGNPGSGTALLMLKSNGYLGLGTTSPSLPLHFPLGMQIGTSGTANQNWHFYSHSSGSDYGLHLYNGNNGSGTHMLVFKSSGSVGIGTSNPDNAYKLSVKGKIRAEEIKVETGWSDFVFKPDYKLRSLKEVESFIKENGHLPEIPSEQEVLADGVELGNISSKLLQKIEELTLYMLEQDKRIENLEKENAKLKKQN